MVITKLKSVAITRISFARFWQVNKLTSPELSVIALNLCLVLVAYTSVFPALAGNNVSRIAMFDAMVSCLSLFIVGSVYWGSEVSFNLLFIEFNWFWFTLISYGVLEVPAYLWYAKKHQINMKQE